MARVKTYVGVPHIRTVSDSMRRGDLSMLLCKGSLCWINSFEGEVEGMAVSSVRVSGFSGYCEAHFT